jgi:prepilin-type processing-associated H-X9-DG protein
MVRMSEISDGSSNTAMIGEKYLNPDKYYDGTYTADDQCVFSGNDNDNNGYTARGTDHYLPKQDKPGVDHAFYFGGPHVEGLHMAFCDGSVRLINYEIDRYVWVKFGGRNDEQLP